VDWPREAAADYFSFLDEIVRTIPELQDLQQVRAGEDKGSDVLRPSGNPQRRPAGAGFRFSVVGVIGYTARYTNLRARGASTVCAALPPVTYTGV
jgi:hypothetical protein